MRRPLTTGGVTNRGPPVKRRSVAAEPITPTQSPGDTCPAERHRSARRERLVTGSGRNSRQGVPAMHDVRLLGRRQGQPSPGGIYDTYIHLETDSGYHYQDKEPAAARRIDERFYF